MKILWSQFHLIILHSLRFSIISFCAYQVDFSNWIHIAIWIMHASLLAKRRNTMHNIQYIAIWNRTKHSKLFNQHQNPQQIDLFFAFALTQTANGKLKLQIRCKLSKSPHESHAITFPPKKTRNVQCFLANLLVLLASDLPEKSERKKQLPPPQR